MPKKKAFGQDSMAIALNIIKFVMPACFQLASSTQISNFKKKK
jgi:hypothetical protein